MEKDIVLITGICGRIGTALQKRLGKNYQVIGFDRTECPAGIRLDLSSEESIQRAVAELPKGKIASVVHLAAYYSFDQEHSKLYHEITVKGTERLLKALQSRDVEQFIFSSTMLVHAPTAPGIKITEDDPLEPSWDYPKSKVATEKLIHRLHGKMKAVVLRIAGVYDDHCHSIPISHQIQRIYERKLEAHFFSGDLTHGASFLHMDDLTEAIQKCIEKRHKLPEEVTLLLGEAETMSYDQLQRRISSLIYGKEIITFRVPKWFAWMGATVLGLIKNQFIKPWMIKMADDHYELDITKAKETIGWQPRHHLNQTLPRMISDLKSDPSIWYEANQLKN